MPQPIKMQTRPVMASAAIRVRVCVLAMISGMTVPTPPEMACAALMTMYETLNPTTVSVTTTITNPTVPAAAPTASAYLAPVANETDRYPRYRRGYGRTNTTS